MNKALEISLKTAPNDPGCYIYRDKNGEILYIGKAKNLRNRVNQYFKERDERPKILFMLDQIDSIEFIKTINEIDALVLESNLIKKYKPKYNSDLKDDKRYIWIAIDRNEDFPRIYTTREQNLKNVEYFGPYPSAEIVKNLLKKIRHVFPYRNCRRKITIEGSEFYSSDTKPCLYYHLGLCGAPCANITTKEDYRRNINKIKSLLRGESQGITSELKKEMVEYSNKLEFEKAAAIRDKIKEFNYFSQLKFIEYGMDEAQAKAASTEKINLALSKFISKIKFDDLKVHDKFKIECYDISNIQGKNAVGSMVVSVDGKAAKHLYRKFKIKVKDTPDDFLMMQEMLTRRLKELDGTDESFSQKPDLMIIDGGKGQLSSAFEILQKFGLNIPVVGLAKREEEIFKVRLDEDNNLKFTRIKLSDNSEELFMIQRIRDEAHRFGITFHRKLRSKNMIVSSLDSIAGMGPITKKKLLLKYKSFEGIKKANKEELKKLINNKTVYRELIKNL